MTSWGSIDPPSWISKHRRLFLLQTFGSDLPKLSKKHFARLSHSTCYCKLHDPTAEDFGLSCAAKWYAAMHAKSSKCAAPCKILPRKDKQRKFSCGTQP